MSRRPPLAYALPLLAACALALSACGEQTPGGIQPGSAQASQSGNDGGQQQDTGGQAESGSDAEDPIVVKIGEDEYETITAIYRKYDSTKSGPLNLQAPVGSAEVVDDGRTQEFVSGVIFWSPETGAQIVRGQILKTYLDTGGVAGALGWPVGDETTEGDAIYSEFENGRIVLENMSIQVIENAA